MSRAGRRIWRQSDQYLQRVDGNLGTREQRLAEEAAQAGSRALRLALVQAVFAFGTKHRITDAEARILLMDTGISL